MAVPHSNPNDIEANNRKIAASLASQIDLSKLAFTSQKAKQDFADIDAWDKNSAKEAIEGIRNISPKANDKGYTLTLSNGGTVDVSHDRDPISGSTIFKIKADEKALQSPEFANIQAQSMGQYFKACGISTSNVMVFIPDIPNNPELTTSMKASFEKAGFKVTGQDPRHAAQQEKTQPKPQPTPEAQSAKDADATTAPKPTMTPT